ncbi:TackOD1 domain-containing metal-binding protein [Deferrisoma sp.]
MAYLLVTDVPDPRLLERLQARGPTRVVAGDRGPDTPGPADRVLLFHADDRRVSEWLRALRRNPATALCPVAAAESPDADRAAEDRIFADALWPLGGSEAALERALARLDHLAEAVGALTPPDPKATATQLREVALLRFLTTRGLERLEPVRHPTATRGYNLPLAGLILGLPRGEEFALCEELAAVGLFEREFRDRIHLCPYCGHYAINFREVCPSCRSPRIQVVSNVHHYRCGHVGPEPEFRDGEDLVCPKCRRVLRHVGVDFDRPNEVVRCLDCGAVNTEPEVECLSLVCGKVFGPEAARKFDVAAYRLTARGAGAAEAGRIPARSLQELLHEHLQTVDPEAFEVMVRLARHLADRYERPYSLAEVAVGGRDQLLDAVGPVETLRVLRTFAEILRGNLRETDPVCPLGESRFRVLFFETPGPGARKGMERAVREVEERLRGTPLGLTIRWLEERP